MSTDASPSEEQSTATAFDSIFQRIASSAVVGEIWCTAFADEYPEYASPFSFVTRSELGTLLNALGLAPSDRLVDLGCGCGGPGLFLAARTGAALDGIDTSAAAVECAEAAATRMGMGERAQFHVADAASTGLPSALSSGVVSIDAMQLMPAPRAVVAEAARLLRSGGVFAFTTWCLSEPWRNRVVVPDYRPLLEDEGFQVLSYAEPDGWRERQLCVYRLTLERRSILEAEVGQSVASLLAAEAEAAPEAIAKSTRVLAVARLPDGSTTYGET